MATENGMVKSISGGTARVSLVRTEACHSCAAKEGCQAMGGGKEMHVDVENSLKAEVGDVVEVSISDTAMLKAVFLVYLFPVVALVGGGFLGDYLGWHYGIDPAAMGPIVGLSLLAVSLLIVRIAGRKLGTLRDYIPRMVRIVRRSGVPCGS